jgi:hypothetical protein
MAPQVLGIAQNGLGNGALPVRGRQARRIDQARSVMTAELRRVRLDPACSVKAGRIERVCRIEQFRRLIARATGVRRIGDP